MPSASTKACVHSSQTDQQRRSDCHPLNGAGSSAQAHMAACRTAGHAHGPRAARIDGCLLDPDHLLEFVWAFHPEPLH